MIASTDLKNGATFLSYGKPFKVIKYSLIKMGRGGAIVRVTARNLETGGIEEKTYSSNVKVESMTTEKRGLQYLYSDEANGVFIDPKTYEQISIAKSVIGRDLDYIKEGEEVDVLFWSDPPAGEASRPLSVEIPLKVTLTVVETPPGVKGNSASNVYKDATLENGIKVKVPLFIKVGEKVKVDTRNGEYVERATK